MEKKLQILKTERLILREISIEDKNEIFNIFSDKNILKYTDNEIHKDINDSISLIEKYKRELKNGESYRWAVCLKTDGKLIGTVSLYHIDYKHKFATIGSILLSEFQRKGIIPEAQKATFDFAFNILKLNRLEGQVYTENFPSIKKLEKLGFEREGKLRQNFVINKKFCDSYMYSLLKKMI